MLNTAIPGVDTHCRLPFFLAAEEWIARNLPEGEYFFAWQVPPTVICGRNQDVPAEVDLGFCRREGIEVYRRKSGGGAVFADRNNIMFSYIAPIAAVATAFSGYTSRVVDALRALGLPAAPSGRNDICIDGRKVAGNAYWQCAERSIVHGTMLYDTDPRLMAGALTPSRAKLESKKVLSVPARITTVKSLLPDLSLRDFLTHMLSHVCDGQLTLPAEAHSEIARISGQYCVEDFMSGDSAATTFRLDGVGQIGSVMLLNSHGTIERVELTGDFLCHRDLAAALMNLSGVPPDREAVAAALGSEAIIAGLTNRQLADIIVR